MNEHRLDSWKAIAAHFDVSVRTVQRWSEDEGLPVHKLVHQGKAGPVYAYVKDLDAWRAERSRRVGGPAEAPSVPQAAPSEPAPPPVPGSPGHSSVRRWHLFLAGSVLAALAGGALVLNHQAATPTKPPEIPGRLLARVTAEGATLPLIPVGRHPQGMAIAPNGCCLYIANNGDNTISVIDLSLRTAVSTIPVGQSPVTLAISPDGSRLYTANLRSGDVSVVALSTPPLDQGRRATPSVESIPVGEYPMDLAVTPDGKTIFITGQLGGLARIDTATRRVEHLTWVAKPEFLAIDASGQTLYINYQDRGPGGSPGHDAIDAVHLPDGRQIAVTRGFPNVGGPMAVSPKGDFLWASGLNACSSEEYDHEGCPAVPSHIFNVIRTADRQRIRGVPLLDAASVHASFFPDAARVAADGESLHVIDTATFDVVERMERRGFGSVIFSPDHRHAYYSLEREDAVAVFDTQAGDCAPPPPGLAGWWSGDGVASDLRRQNHGQAEGRLLFAPGRVGQSFRFDGGNSLHLGRLSNIGGTRDFTIAAWVKFTAPSSRPMPIFDKMQIAGKLNDGWQLLREPDGRILFWVAPCRDCGSDARSRTAPAAGKWFHIAATKSRNELSLYIDGIREANVAMENDVWLDHANASLVVGGTKSSKASLDGMVDEIQWFNRPLAASEVYGIFRAGGAGLCYSPPR